MKENMGSLSHRSQDLPDRGAIRQGKLWFDKETKRLSWIGSKEYEELTETESEIVRLLMSVSYSDSQEGGIITTSDLLQWINDTRGQDDKQMTEMVLYQHIHKLNDKLLRLTNGSVRIENGNKNPGYAIMMAS